jgi:hypothetical protein
VALLKLNFLKNLRSRGVEMRRVDYARMVAKYAAHHLRFEKHVAEHGILCQECGGMGGWTERILDDGTGPFEPCGWCEGTGKTTRWLRGVWLSFKKMEKRTKYEIRNTD